MNVEDLIHASAPVVDIRASIEDAIHSMDSDECPYAIVLSETGQVVGTLNKFDLLEGVRFGEMINDYSNSIANWIHTLPTQVTENDDIHSVIEKFLIYDVLQLPVIRKGEYIGSICFNRILRMMVEQEADILTLTKLRGSYK